VVEVVGVAEDSVVGQVDLLRVIGADPPEGAGLRSAALEGAAATSKS
jgi:hypothetical protein